MVFGRSKIRGLVLGRIENAISDAEISHLVQIADAARGVGQRLVRFTATGTDGLLRVSAHRSYGGVEIFISIGGPARPMGTPQDVRGRIQRFGRWRSAGQPRQPKLIEETGGQGNLKCSVGGTMLTAALSGRDEKP